MRRRIFLAGIGSALVLEHRAAAAQEPEYTHWRNPGAYPYQLGDQQALQSFADLLNQYGLYADMQNAVLRTPGDPDELQPLPRGFKVTRMLFGTGQRLPNVIVVPEDLGSRGWEGRTRSMQVWTVEKKIGGQKLIAQYYRHAVCQNRSLFLGWVQGECILDRALCEQDADCIKIKRAQKLS